MLTIFGNSLYALYSDNVDTMSLYSPLNLYLIILWILDFKYILLLLLLSPLFLLYCGYWNFKYILLLLLLSPLYPVYKTDMHSTHHFFKCNHIHSVVIPGFVDEPRGSGRADGHYGVTAWRRTNHGTIGPPPCYMRWWIDNTRRTPACDVVAEHHCTDLNTKKDFKD